MAEERNGGRMPTLCCPDKLQKNSIERSVPQAEGAWSVFGYFLLTKKYQWPAFGWVLVFAFVFGFDLKKESGTRWETYKSPK